MSKLTCGLGITALVSLSYSGEPRDWVRWGSTRMFHVKLSENYMVDHKYGHLENVC